MLILVGVLSRWTLLAETVDVKVQPHSCHSPYVELVGSFVALVLTFHLYVCSWGSEFEIEIKVFPEPCALRLQSTIISFSSFHISDGSQCGCLKENGSQKKWHCWEVWFVGGSVSRWRCASRSHVLNSHPVRQATSCRLRDVGLSANSPAPYLPALLHVPLWCWWTEPLECKQATSFECFPL